MSHQGSLFGPTLEEARDDFEALVRKGTACPCCDRFGKTYKRKLNSGMARDLIKIWRQHQQRPFHWSDSWRGREIHKLRFWELLSQLPDRDEATSGPKGGWWKITDAGADFVMNRIGVAGHVYVFGNVCKGLSDETTDIVQALGDHFDYHELMRA